MEVSKTNFKTKLKNLWDYFTTYEKTWFFGIIVLAFIFAFIFPEEDANGVKGIVIMALYLLDTLFNITCELLISKQSKWNFIVSLLVEITEIIICIVLAYRFATMATTLFFWIPIDIISFINWNKHPDKKYDELTQVRKLKGWQEIAVISGIVIWTVVVGYLLTLIDLGTDFFNGNRTLEIVVCYFDACVSAVGIANGLFILFRYREQWIAWYIASILEAVINILSGQYVLLVLKAGYLTNTTYGYIKWTKYIKAHPETSEVKSLL
jgi:nicotinamide mononucleotide transporter